MLPPGVAVATTTAVATIEPRLRARGSRPPRALVRCAVVAARPRCRWPDGVDRMAVRLAALALAATLAGAGPAAAQLPAPPASARGPIRIAAWGTIAYGLSTAEEATTTTPAGSTPAGTPAPPAGTPPGTPPPVSAPAGRVASTAAVLVSGTLFQRLSYFGEIDGARRTFENWPGTRDDRGWEVDRAYAELALGDAVRLRAGRFLTPIGQWNERHADPLTWTAERPLTTYRPFAKSVTGVLVGGQLAVSGHDAGYALFYAPVLPVMGDAAETAFAGGFGGRVAVELLPNLYLGASAAGFRGSWPSAADDDSVEEVNGRDAGDSGDPGTGVGGTDNRRVRAVGPRTRVADAQAPSPGTEGPGDRELDTTVRRLMGVDLSWMIGRLELLAEATALTAAGWRPPERGAFVQATVGVLGPLFLVARSEVYTPVVRETLHLQTLGAALRPMRHLTLKLDRQITDRPSTRAPDGWFVSASALF